MQSLVCSDRLKPTVDRAKQIAVEVASADGAAYVICSVRDLTSLNLISRVADTNRPQWVLNGQLDPTVMDACAISRADDFRSAAAVPVRRTDGAVTGVLVVVWRQPNTQESARVEAALLAVADLIARDIERLGEIEALRQTTQRSSVLIDSVPLSLMMTDRDMRLLEATPRWLADFGVCRADVMGQCLYVLDPGHFEKFRPLFDRCLAGGTVRIGRLRLPPVAGRHHWLQAELSPWFEANGAVGGVIGAAADITDTVEALESAERSAQRLQLATEIAELHVWEIDYGKGTVETAGAMESFFDRGFASRELIADASVTVHPDDRARIALETARVIDEDAPGTLEYRTNRADGREVWAACRVQMVKDEQGRPKRLLGVMQNISERKAAEKALTLARDEAQAANIAKTNFLATMSHEIRTPLNGVLGMAQAMCVGELTEGQRERLDVIRQSGESLLAILNDMLDLSKVEAGKLTLEAIAFDLEEIARGAHATFTALANKQGLSFNLEIDGAQGVYLGDPTRVRQILYNLISNALKFTETGEIRVEIAYDGAELIVTVSDTGIGMTDEVISKLFNKFTQADASTTRKFGGTGLGLAICRQLADLMEGSIAVTSELGRGSVFTFKAPIIRLADGAAVETNIPIAAPPQNLNIRVLAAEDNMVNQLVLRTLLHQIDISPVIVDNGMQALEAWDREHWDIILMDVQMPLMDGPAAARAIRAREAETGRRRTPIIALTANAMSHQISEYLACGMDCHVVKPIEASKLFYALGLVLGVSESEGHSQVNSI